MTRPVVVIGRYEPQNRLLPIFCTQTELIAEVHRLGFEEAPDKSCLASSHIREFGITKGHIGNTCWHQDRLRDEAPDCTLLGETTRFQTILWASESPTEFRFNGAIWLPKPFELVLVRNWLCEHRQPIGVQRTRLFARFWNVIKRRKR